MTKRVVVTGIGVISSIAIGREIFWKNLLAGKSGISKITSFDTSDMVNKYGGEVKDFDPSKFIAKKNFELYGRASQFAVAAAQLAVKDANIDLCNSKQFDGAIDVLVGTTMGEIQALEFIDNVWVKKGEENISSPFILQYPSNSIAMSVAHELKLSGASIVIPTACAAGNYAIGYGYDLIKTNKSNMVLAGGAEAFSRIAYTGFSRMFAMSPLMCSPFDKNRQGMMVAEGSGFLLLESLESAKNRDAYIYSEILGYGLTCDASHMTIPSEEGVSSVMSKALKDAQISIEQVDYISAHGTGTPMNDKIEAQAIKKVFGERSSKMPVSSIKSMLGHPMGAASALEAIACCLCIKDGQIPPTINFQTPDPECPIDCVPNKSRQQKVEVALNNSFAFGGNNACVVFSQLN